MNCTMYSLIFMMQYQKYGEKNYINKAFCKEAGKKTMIKILYVK